MTDAELIERGDAIIRQALAERDLAREWMAQYLEDHEQMD